MPELPRMAFRRLARPILFYWGFSCFLLSVLLILAQFFFKQRQNCFHGNTPRHSIGGENIPELPRTAFKRLASTFLLYWGFPCFLLYVFTFLHRFYENSAKTVSMETTQSMAQEARNGQICHIGPPGEVHKVFCSYGFSPGLLFVCFSFWRCFYENSAKTVSMETPQSMAQEEKNGQSCHTEPPGEVLVLFCTIGLSPTFLYVCFSFWCCFYKNSAKTVSMERPQSMA